MDPIINYTDHLSSEEIQRWEREELNDNYRIVQYDDWFYIQKRRIVRKFWFFGPLIEDWIPAWYWGYDHDIPACEISLEGAVNALKERLNKKIQKVHLPF